MSVSLARVKVGDTIVWVNHDSVVHNATARDKSFNAHIQVGQSARTVMSKAGTIPSYASTTPRCAVR